MRKCRSGLGEDAVTALRETPDRREFSRWPHPPAVCFSHLHYLAPVGMWTYLPWVTQSTKTCRYLFVTGSCWNIDNAVEAWKSLLDLQQLSFACGKHRAKSRQNSRVSTTGYRKPSKPSRDSALKVLNAYPQTTLKAHFDWLTTSGIPLASCLDKWVNFSST